MMPRGPLSLLQVTTMPEGIDDGEQKQGYPTDEQHDDDWLVFPQVAREPVKVIAHPPIAYTKVAPSAT